MKTTLSLSATLLLLLPQSGVQGENPFPEPPTKTLLKEYEFLKESPEATTLSKVCVPPNTEVFILLDGKTSYLAEYQGHRRWVPAQDFLESPPGPDAPTWPQKSQSELNPYYTLVEEVPLEITAKISSLKHYPPNPNEPLNTISPADFSLVWGPYDIPAFESHQSLRAAIAKTPKGWQKTLGDLSLSWRNFHLISTSKAITEKILSCQEGDRVSLRGSLASVQTPTGASIWPTSLAMGFCPILVVHDLKIVEENRLTEHPHQRRLTLF